MPIRSLFLNNLIGTTTTLLQAELNARGWFFEYQAKRNFSGQAHKRNAASADVLVRNPSVLLESRTHAKCVAIRMTQVKLAHVPGLISRWHSHHHSILDRHFMRGVNVSG